jgi:hypothetical protein
MISPTHWARGGGSVLTRIYNLGFRADTRVVSPPPPLIIVDDRKCQKSVVLSMEGYLQLYAKEDENCLGESGTCLGVGKVSSGVGCLVKPSGSPCQLIKEALQSRALSGHPIEGHLLHFTQISIPPRPSNRRPPPPFYTNLHSTENCPAPPF